MRLVSTPLIGSSDFVESFGSLQNYNLESYVKSFESELRLDKCTQPHGNTYRVFPF